MKKLLEFSLTRFLLVGVGNTLLSAILMFLLEGLGYWPSTAIAYAAGSVLSFFLNRSFTFHSGEAIGESAIRFLICTVVCYIVGYGLAQLFVRDIGTLSLLWEERLRKMVGMCLYTLFNYCGQRFFIFRTQK